MKITWRFPYKQLSGRCQPVEKVNKPPLRILVQVETVPTTTVPQDPIYFGFPLQVQSCGKDDLVNIWLTFKSSTHICLQEHITGNITQALLPLSANCVRSVCKQDLKGIWQPMNNGRDWQIVKYCISMKMEISMCDNIYSEIWKITWKSVEIPLHLAIGRLTQIHIFSEWQCTNGHEFDSRFEKGMRDTCTIYS